LFSGLGKSPPFQVVFFHPQIVTEFMKVGDSNLFDESALVFLAILPKVLKEDVNRGWS
jgi:hypothetical protein